MRVYVSGPMRGYEGFNFPAFHQATAMLRAHGHTVWCPAEMSLELALATGRELRDIEFEEYMAEHDIPALTAVYGGGDGDGAIALLPGWRNSTGAKAEVFIGNLFGLFIYELESGEEVKGLSINLALAALVGEGVLG